MTVQNLIIYKFNELYQILEELDLDLNFKIIVADNKESLNEKTKKMISIKMRTPETRRGRGRRSAATRQQRNGEAAPNRDQPRRP